MKKIVLAAVALTLAITFGCSSTPPPTGVGASGVGTGTCASPAGAVANIGNTGGRFVGINAPADLKDMTEAQVISYIDNAQNQTWWDNFKCLYPALITAYKGIPGKIVK